MRRLAIALLMVLLVESVVIFQSSCSRTGLPVPPYTKYPGVKVVNMIPASQSLETNQDSEPFLSIFPTNTQQMAGSAFTPNSNPLATAPIYFTNDGGNTWTLQSILPVPGITPGVTNDITHSYVGNGNNFVFYAGMLFGCPLPPLPPPNPPCITVRTLDELASGDATLSTTMTVQASRSNDDQPFTLATTAGASNRIYIGNNDTSQSTGNGRTATVDVSGNGGINYTSARLETRKPADLSGCTGFPDSQDGPSVRPSIAKDGTVYVAYFGWRTFNGENPDCSIAKVTSDVVVVRDDNGATGANPFQDLRDPPSPSGDGLVGIRVARNVTISWSNTPTLGQERIGSTLSLAVDPNNSKFVYVAWADVVGNGDIQTIHVRNSIDRGVSWSQNDLISLRDATNVALAIADNGTVGLLYQEVFQGNWVTHLIQTKNAFSNIQDGVLASTPSDVPVLGNFLPYLGDYVGLMAVGNEFRGVFCANNTPDMNNFPQGVPHYQRFANFDGKSLSDGQGGTVAISIDPFYFSFPVMQ